MEMHHCNFAANSFLRSILDITHKRLHFYFQNTFVQTSFKIKCSVIGHRLYFVHINNIQLKINCNIFHVIKHVVTLVKWS